MSEGKTPPRDAFGESIASALAEWPTKERSAEEWEEAAERVEARLESVAVSRLGLPDDKLFTAPLPAESGEPKGEQTSEGRLKVADRARDRASFQELANFAKQAGLTPPPSGVHRSAPPSRSEDSGVIDLQALAASETPPPPASRADAATEPTKAPPSRPRVEPETKVAVVAPPSPPVTAVPATVTTGPRRSRGWILGTLGSLAAVAASVVIYASFVRPHADSGTSAQATTTPADKGAPVATTAAVSSRSNGDTVDPNALPVVQNGALHAAPMPTLPSKPASPVPLALASALAQAPPPAPSPTDTAPATAPTATSDDTNLDQALRAAAGVTPSSAPNADNPSTDPGELPLKPSQGAAQAALTQALPSARACVGPDDGESQVTVTFGPSGGAQRVSIGGGAAGKPAEGCIRAAMMRAHVPPFAQSSFSWSVIVRPM